MKSHASICLLCLVFVSNVYAGGRTHGYGGGSTYDKCSCTGLREELRAVIDRLDKVDEYIEDLYELVDTRWTEKPPTTPYPTTSPSTTTTTTTEPTTTTTTEPTTTTTTQRYSTSTLPPRECPEGFVQFDGDELNCYKVVTHKKTWSAGQEYCQGLHKEAYLAVVKSAVQHRAIESHLTQYYDKVPQCYISGANNEIFFTSGRRVTSSCLSNFAWLYQGRTEPIGETFWQPGEPNCYGGLPEYCMQYRCDGGQCLWNDYVCTYPSCLICQLALP